jgi:hypothetical protein
MPRNRPRSSDNDRVRLLDGGDSQESRQGNDPEHVEGSLPIKPGDKVEAGIDFDIPQGKDYQPGFPFS